MRRLPWARRCNKLHSTICIVLLSEFASRNARLQHFVLRKEKKKLTPLVFFVSFSLQQIPPSFYFLHINGEREIGVILVPVWLRTKPQFCCLTITGYSTQGPIYLLLQIVLERREPQVIFTGVMRDRRSIFRYFFNADMV